jgi:hypothetical protein
MFCQECGQERPATHPPAFSTEHVAEASRRRLAKLAQTPYSKAITIMRKRPAPAPASRPTSLTTAQKEARAAVLAARKAAGPTPKERAEAALKLGSGALAVPPPAQTTSILDAEAAMRIERSPDAARRLLDSANHGTLLDSEVDDVLIRAKGLVPFNAELDQRRINTAAVETRGRRPDLSG